jgi:hypothetical protein
MSERCGTGRRERNGFIWRFTRDAAYLGSTTLRVTGASTVPELSFSAVLIRLVLASRLIHPGPGRTCSIVEVAGSLHPASEEIERESEASSRWKLRHWNGFAASASSRACEDKVDRLVRRPIHYSVVSTTALLPSPPFSFLSGGEEKPSDATDAIQLERQRNAARDSEGDSFRERHTYLRRSDRLSRSQSITPNSSTHFCMSPVSPIFTSHHQASALHYLAISHITCFDCPLDLAILTASTPYSTVEPIPHVAAPAPG